MKTIAVAFLCLLISPIVGAATAEPVWIADTNTGCKVWVPAVQPGESISWSGSCQNGVARGHGVLQWIENGQASTRVEGDFADGKLGNHGIMTWPNGSRYDGDFVDGKQTGRGVYTWSNGDRYEGDFVDSARTGRGVYTWSDGEHYEGDFVDGRRTGHGVFVWKVGDRYEGSWLNNKENGPGTYYCHDGRHYSGDWSWLEKSGIWHCSDDRFLRWRIPY